jgi:hypothetical protein
VRRPGGQAPARPWLVRRADTSGANFSAGGDGHGGVLITDPPASSSVVQMCSTVSVGDGRYVRGPNAHRGPCSGCWSAQAARCALAPHAALLQCRAIASHASNILLGSGAQFHRAETTRQAVYAENRALRLLAGSPLGCTEAIMLAHGFAVETLSRLVLDCLATATPGTVNVGGRPITVTWLTITEIGRQALAG